MALQGIQRTKWDKLLTFVSWTANSEVFSWVCSVPVSPIVVLNSVADTGVVSPLTLCITITGTQIFLAGYVFSRNPGSDSRRFLLGDAVHLNGAFKLPSARARHFRVSFSWKGSQDSQHIHLQLFSKCFLDQIKYAFTKTDEVWSCGQLKWQF